MKAKINVKSIRYRPSEDSLAARIDVVDENSTYSYAGKLTVTTKHFDKSDIYELRDSKWVIPKDIDKTHSDAVYEALKCICLHLPPESYRQANTDAKGVYMSMWKNLYIDVDPLGLGIKLKVGNKYVIGKKRSHNNKYTLYSKDIESLVEGDFERYIPTQEEMPIVSKLIGYALSSANAKHKRFQKRRMA